MDGRLCESNRKSDGEADRISYYNDLQAVFPENISDIHFCIHVLLVKEQVYTFGFFKEEYKRKLLLAGRNAISRHNC